MRSIQKNFKKERDSSIDGDGGKEGERKRRGKRER